MDLRGKVEIGVQATQTNFSSGKNKAPEKSKCTGDRCAQWFVVRNGLRDIWLRSLDRTGDRVRLRVGPLEEQSWKHPGSDAGKVLQGLDGEEGGTDGALEACWMNALSSRPVYSP